MPRVTIWNEYRHERTNPEVAALYPEGIDGALAGALCADGLAPRIARLDEPEHGLTDAVLADTDVLTWWGHAAHAEVADAVVARVAARVNAGMGLVVLHSGHHSKVFKALMGTTCDLRWRESGEREQVWVALPGHPLAQGLPASFEIPRTEMYGEPFDIPAPDDVVLISGFANGDVFRSGCTFRRGAGRVVYFGPGHETFPIYHQPEVRRFFVNAVRWAGERT